MAKMNINKKARKKKGAVPTLEQASNNMGTPTEEFGRFQFKMPKSFIKEFKTFALDNDISMTELFKRSFEYYKSNV